MSSNQPPEKVDKSAGRSRFSLRFFRDRSGSTAIEFGVLAVPFLVLVFGIVEVCVSMAAQQVLTNVTFDIGRQVRTGELAAANLNETKLKEMICSRLEVMVKGDCTEVLKLDLRQVSSFKEAAELGKQWSPDNFVSNPQVSAGNPLDMTVLRTFYRWPVILSFLADIIGNTTNGHVLLFSMAAWQNEPFPSPPGAATPPQP